MRRMRRRGEKEQKQKQNGKDDFAEYRLINKQGLFKQNLSNFGAP